METIIKNNTKFLEDITDNKSNTAIDNMDRQLAETIAIKLLEIYPGYGWVIDVNSRQGIVTILCGQVQEALQSNFPYKFIFKMGKLVNHKLMVKKIIMGAGEILERAGLPRGKNKGDRPVKVDGVKPYHQPKGIIYDA